MPQEEIYSVPQEGPFQIEITWKPGSTIDEQKEVAIGLSSLMAQVEAHPEEMPACVNAVTIRRTA